MGEPDSQPYVSRGGEKLAAALDHFGIDISGRVCADLGSHIGGFVDCLLQRGAAKVYSVDTCYGTLAWKLRRDPRVVVLERTNAMHVSLPESVDLATIDVGWTPQAKILPNVASLLRPHGRVVTLVKPQYEATACDGAQPDEASPLGDGGATPVPSPADKDRGTSLAKGGKRGVGRGSKTERAQTEPVLSDETAEQVVDHVLRQIEGLGWTVRDSFTSPIRGHGGNLEVFAHLARVSA